MSPGLWRGPSVSEAEEDKGTFEFIRPRGSAASSGAAAGDPSRAKLAADVRDAFSQGISAEAAGVLLDAREADVPWEVVTRAAASGLSQHFGTSMPAGGLTARRPALGRLAALAIGMYVLLRPLLGLGHELAVGGVAWSLHALVAGTWWETLIGWIGLDPIYAGAAVRAAGGVDVAGLAVAGPLGAWLHALVPWAILGPDRVAPEAAFSMVAAPGAPALGRGLAEFGADVLWLAAGMWLVRGWRRRGPIVGGLGLLIQGQIVVNHLLEANVSIPDLEASGLPFALALALPNSGEWFTTALGRLSEPLRTLVVGLSLVVVAYSSAGVAVLALSRVRRLLLMRIRPSVGGASPLVSADHRLLLACAAVALVAAVSPIGALAVGVSNWPGEAPARMPDPRPPVSTPAHEPIPDLLTPRDSGLVRVQLVQDPKGTWHYLVNGRPRVIRGVGYNPQYAGLSPAERTAKYDSDFAAMRRLGINTIEGWFETEFDEVTLDAAARHRIGVIMPFELNQDWPIDNPNVQHSTLDHISAYVERYRGHPAVRWWAPGNENLHRVLYPHWVSQESDPRTRARADAFAAFLPVLVDRIHALDADHPVLYRDAEDTYLGRLNQAFQATGIQRPWLAYGANVYSQVRLKQVIDAWPSRSPGGPLVISEFAPGGLGPADRPLGFEQDWAIIRSHPEFVLGGLAYTWAINGPEELDRVFGLVDAQGIPCDGALAALSASYLRDPE